MRRLANSGKLRNFAREGEIPEFFFNLAIFAADPAGDYRSVGNVLVNLPGCRYK
jgi:hypothetical protein